MSPRKIRIVHDLTFSASPLARSVNAETDFEKALPVELNLVHALWSIRAFVSDRDRRFSVRKLLHLCKRLCSPIGEALSVACSTQSGFPRSRMGENFSRVPPGHALPPTDSCGARVSSRYRVVGFSGRGGDCAPQRVDVAPSLGRSYAQLPIFIIWSDASLDVMGVFCLDPRAGLGGWWRFEFGAAVRARQG